MIARLRGIVAERTKEQVIIDVNGVGYGLMVPETILFRMPEVGQEVTLQVYTHVREDAILLFGFLTTLEREVFEILLSASGVGPKLATSILSSLDAGHILESIAHGNKAALNGITGVGKKTAERLVLELREKCEKKLLLERGSFSSTANPQKGKASPIADGNKYAWLSDLEAALLGLGYKENDIRAVTREIPAETTGFEAALKWCLQKLGTMHTRNIRGTA